MRLLMNDAMVTKKNLGKTDPFCKAQLRKFFNIVMTGTRTICGEQNKLMNGNVHFQKSGVKALKYVFTVFPCNGFIFNTSFLMLSLKKIRIKKHKQLGIIADSSG
jgi:hypothetical protein